MRRKKYVSNDLIRLPAIVSDPRLVRRSGFGKLRRVYDDASFDLKGVSSDTKSERSSCLRFLTEII